MYEPGSPPPTRGTPNTLPSAGLQSRITPAYAGNTLNVLDCTALLWDHPRLRGEHLFCGTYQLLQPGSPPPTRGTLSKWNENMPSIGITPAYAGNTLCDSICLNRIWDHPRLRGEHPHFLDQIHIYKGSPPPTRGTQQSITPC